MLDFNTSILTREQMQELLKLAGGVLEKVGYVNPMLIVQYDNGIVGHVNLDSESWNASETSRRQIMKDLVPRIQSADGNVQAAALIGQTWSMDTDKYPDGPGMPIEEHPDRHDAMGVVARNADNSLCSAVEQLVLPTNEDKSVLGRVARELYEQPPQLVGITSILDDLFTFLNEGQRR